MNPFIIAAGALAVIAAAGGKAEASSGSSSSGSVSEFDRWDKLIRKNSAIYGIPWRWMKAIMIIESDLGRAPSVARGLMYPTDIQGSKSSDGKSWGLMQLTLPTARQFEPSVTEESLNDPNVSVRIAGKYMAWVRDRYWPLSNREAFIRSYNGGPGFNKTVSGQRDTPAYYAKFLKALSTVMAAQPGDEMEIG